MPGLHRNFLSLKLAGRKAVSIPRRSRNSSKMLLSTLPNLINRLIWPSPNFQRLGCTLQNSLANPSSPHSSLCSNPNLGDPVKRIFKRQINDSGDQYPYNTIGKIFAGANLNFASPLWTGTGVLVGPDLLLTASRSSLGSARVVDALRSFL